MSLQVDRLIARAAQGDQRAVDELWTRFRGRLCGSVAARFDPRLQSRVDPSDIVQETLVAATRKLPDYQRRQPVPFFLWLRQMALERLVHAQRRHINAQKRSVTVEVPLAPGVSDDSCEQIGRQLSAADASPSQSVLRREYHSLLRQALMSIAPDDRDLLIMKYVEHLTSEEIAAALDASVPAVKMRHLRALRRLRDVLDAASGPE